MNLSPTFAKAAGLILLSELCLVLSGASIRHISSSLSVEIVVFVRNLIGLLLLLPWLASHGLGSIKTSSMPLHLLRGVIGIMAMYCFFYSWANLPLAQAALIKQTSPFFVPVIALAWLKESIGYATKVAITLGFIGVCFILEPSAEGINAVVIVALVGAALSAFAKVVVRRLTRTEPGTRIVFYFSFYAALLSAIPAILNWQNPSLQEWGFLLVIAALTTSAQLFLTRAYAQAQAGLLAPYTYSSVIFAAGLGWAFWGDVLSWLNWLGFLVIFIAGLVNLSAKAKQA